MRHGHVKVMVVGCGVQGKKHLEAYLEINNVIPIVCEASEARRRELKAEYPRLELVSDFTRC